LSLSEGRRQARRTGCSERCSSGRCARATRTPVRRPRPERVILRATSLGGGPGTDEANHRSRGDRRGLDVDDGSGRPGRAALWTSSYQRQRMDRVGPRRFRLEPQSLHVERGQPVLARELAAQAAPVQVDDERSRELGRQPAQPAELHIPPRLTAGLGRSLHDRRLTGLVPRRERAGQAVGVHDDRVPSRVEVGRGHPQRPVWEFADHSLDQASRSRSKPDDDKGLALLRRDLTDESLPVVVRGDHDSGLPGHGDRVNYTPVVPQLSESLFSGWRR